MKKTKITAILSMVFLFTAAFDGYAGGGKDANKRNPPAQNESPKTNGRGGNKPPPGNCETRRDESRPGCTLIFCPGEDPKSKCPK